MFFLVAVALIGAVASEPQHYMGYGLMSPRLESSMFSIPYSPIHGASLHTMYPSAMPAALPYSHSMIYPSMDISMARSSMMPKEVEDTPEVKKAKMDFELAYHNAMMVHSESTPVVRAKRDVTRIMPYGYDLPYSGYMTPFGHFPNPALHQASPYSRTLIPHNVLHAPYFARV